MTCENCLMFTHCRYDLEGNGTPCEHFKNKADVIEERHGKWMPTNIPSYFGGMIYKCSLCGANDRVHSSIFGTYCWRCGAKMDGGNK